MRSWVEIQVTHPSENDGNPQTLHVRADDILFFNQTKVCVRGTTGCYYLVEGEYDKIRSTMEEREIMRGSFR
jgi:hypothetical protein